MSMGYDLAVPGPIGSLEAYARQTELYPRLTEEEEQRLARRYRRHNDLDAALKLVLSNLQLSLQVARQYRGYGLPMEDLVQEGNVGLMKAVRRFDPARGVPLFKYALLWIRAEIHGYILRNWRIVRVATNQAKKKLFFKLRGAKKALQWVTESEASEIADRLKVPTDEVLDMDMRLYAKDAPFDALSDDSNDDTAPVPADYLADSRFAPDRVVEEREWRDWARDQLHDAVKRLDMRSRDILVRRCLNDNKATLNELGAEYGLSAERIRQIENSAVRKLRELVLARCNENRDPRARGNRLAPR